MKRLLLFICATVTLGSTLLAQRNSNSVSAVLMPEYIASGASSSHMITYTRLRVGPLMPNSQYKYIARCFDAKGIDTNDISGGFGNAIYDDNGTHRYVTSHSFSSAGGHDTFSTNFMGFAELWVGYVADGSSIFTDGKAVYAGLTLIGLTASDTSYLYSRDSMTVISFGTAANSNKGTGIYGECLANEAHYVVLYDNTNMVGRPLAVASIEGGTYTGSSLNTFPTFYGNNVHNKSKMWGAIIPNELTNGVRSIARWNAAALFQYNQQSDDGLWGASQKDTRNPRGGTSAISLSKTDAPLIAPEISFESSQSLWSEKDSIAEVVIVRRYGNNQTQTVDVVISGGSATDSIDFIRKFSKTITFAKGGDVSDTIKINILQDEIAEGNENVFFRLENAQNGSLGNTRTHELVIFDDDELFINMAQSKLVVNENAGTLSIEVKTNRAVKEPVSMTMLIKSHSDSTFIPQEFALGRVNTRDTTFSIGKTTGRDSVKITSYIGDDLVWDWDDSVVVVIRKNNGLGEIIDSTCLVIIKDNDGPSTVRMLQSSVVVSESVGTVPVRILVVEKKDAGGDFALRYLTAESSATAGTDLTFNPISQLKSIDATSPDTFVFNVPINDDDIFEGTEYAKFGLINVSNVIISKPDTFLITILDNDLPFRNIGVINKQTKSDGQVDSLNVRCRIRGVVYGGNMRTTGLGFTLRDPSGGIGVFSESKTFGYTVREGDSVMIQGKVGQFQGTAQMIEIDTIIRYLSGVNLKNPRLVTAITESEESDLVQLNRVKLVDPTEWPDTELNANFWAYVRVQGSSGRIDTLYIDAETDIDGTPAPAGYMNIVGLGIQFDNSVPYKDKYFLAPRSLKDFSVATLPVVRFESTTSEITELADSLIMNLRVNPTDENFTVDVVHIGGTAVSPKDFDFETRTVSIIKNQNFYVVKANISDDKEEDGTKTLIFALRNVVGPGSIGSDSIMNVTILDDEAVRVKKFADGSLQLFPNPSNGVMYIRDLKSQVSSVRILNITGKVVYENQQPEHVGISIPVSLNSGSGIYFVEVKTLQGDVYTEKLVIK
jgi:hypothetical protein